MPLQGDGELFCLYSDRIALWEPQNSPAYPSWVPSRTFSFWVASFVKFLLGLALIICFLISLSVTELLRRAKFHMSWEGTQHGSQPLEWVRAAVEEKGRHWV